MLWGYVPANGSGYGVNGVSAALLSTRVKMIERTAKHSNPRLKSSFPLLMFCALFSLKLFAFIDWVPTCSGAFYDDSACDS